MDTSHIIALCAVVFCLATFLNSVFNRPVIVVEPRENKGNSGCLAFMGVLLLMAFFVIWLLLPSANQTDKVQPLLPKEKKEKPQDEVGDNNPLQVKEPFINRKPQSSVKLQKEVDAKNEGIDRWIICMKIFHNLATARQFKSEFPELKMKICRTDDSEFWACVLVEDESQGRQKIKSWGYYRDMGCELKLMEVEFYKR